MSVHSLEKNNFDIARLMITVKLVTICLKNCVQFSKFQKTRNRSRPKWIAFPFWKWKENLGFPNPSYSLVFLRFSPLGNSTISTPYLRTCSSAEYADYGVCTDKRMRMRICVLSNKDKNNHMLGHERVRTCSVFCVRLSLLFDLRIHRSGSSKDRWFSDMDG